MAICDPLASRSFPATKSSARWPAVGGGVEDFEDGQRVGVGWLGSTCGECEFCKRGEENLCDFAKFTGYQIDGGFAEYAVADARYCFPIPDGYSDAAAAPLMCAGLIGYRALKMSGRGRALGIFGFGAAAHIAAQVAYGDALGVHAFTRPGDIAAQAFARSVGLHLGGRFR